MNTKAPLRKLPIGIQSFEKLRQEGYVYVDKTALVYQLAVLGNPCFLSRPRRFGKSLLLSTFEAYFQGKRELFHGLAIEELEEEWTVRPVLHLSLNAEKYDSVDVLRNLLETQLGVWEELYGSKARANPSLSVRFMSVIRRACEVSGQRVAVLIDEYDKPLLRNFHDTKLQDEFRELLTAFYTVLKDADPYLQFVLITGVTKFAQMGIFGTLNQLQFLATPVSSAVRAVSVRVCCYPPSRPTFRVSASSSTVSPSRSWRRSGRYAPCFTSASTRRNTTAWMCSVTCLRPSSAYGKSFTAARPVRIPASPSVS